MAMCIDVKAMGLPDTDSSYLPTYLPTYLQEVMHWNDPAEMRMRAVYKDLWERGLTIGSGTAYGADLTTYEGR